MYDYYQHKALRKVGFTFRAEDYDPYHLSILSFIESEFNVLEAKEMEKTRKKAGGKSVSKPVRRRR